MVDNKITVGTPVLRCPLRTPREGCPYVYVVAGERTPGDGCPYVYAAAGERTPREGCPYVYAAASNIFSMKMP